MKEKFVTFIKSLELRHSDLFLLLGFIPFAFFLVFGQLFMQYQNPSDVNFSLIAMIICFSVSLGSWWTYLILEHERGTFKVNYIAYIFIILIILNCFVIIFQPQIFEVDMFSRSDRVYEIGDLVHITVDVSPFHKAFFCMDITLVALFVFIGLFIFPKRFKSIKFIEVLCWVGMAFMFVVIIYSYATEYDKYAGLVKGIIDGKSSSELDKLTVTSFIINKNAFGMAMLMAIIFAIINHAFNKKWFNYVFIGYFFISMLFSLSKTSILLAMLIIVIYVFFRLFYAYNEHKKRNLILIIIYGSLIVISVGLMLLSYLTEGRVLGFIYDLLDGKGNTLQMRTNIWDNTYLTLQNGWWVIGRGFGIINLIIYPMNIANGDEVFPTHNSFVNMIGEGGIIYLFAYLTLLVYTVIIILKSFKKNPNMMMALTLGAATFFIYSFIETIHYLLYVYIFLIFVFYEVEKYKETQALENKEKLKVKPLPKRIRVTRE